jgi:hypothetical protein
MQRSKGWILLSIRKLPIIIDKLVKTSSWRWLSR